MSSFNRILSVLCSFSLLASLEARSVAKQLGPAVVVSPDPDIYPDPVLENLETVMDNFFQKPWYPGNVPYLKDILYTSNNYYTSRIIVNPLNSNIMHIAIAQNEIFDDSNVYNPIFASNTFATSRDGGKTWKYGPPIEQIIPLGGSISQLINASLGPGLAYTYTKDGVIYAYGNGYFDLHPNPPHTVPTTGFLFTRSYDEGETWDPVETVLVSDKDWWITGSTNTSVAGLGPREFYITPDPAHPHIIHACTSYIEHPLLRRGSGVYYLKSVDGGKTFSPPRKIYDLLEDPVWVKNNFNPYIINDKNLILPGVALVTGVPIFYDDNTILIPIYRKYPRKSPSVVNYSDLKTITYDQAFVRSEDNGKTWKKVAGATDQFLGRVNNIYDPGWEDAVQQLLVNGKLNRGTFLEGSISAAPAFQGSTPIISPLTGRIYICYQVNTPAFGMTPIVLHPTANSLAVSVSLDKGKTFSHPVQANRTPTDIPMGAQQSFSHATVMTKDGHLAIAYYDFRNWTGFPGELKPPPFDNTDANMPPLQTDCWLDIYKEVEDPKGGSTGIGLDFVEEIRLTPESFNTRLSYKDQVTILNATATIEGIPVAVSNDNVLHVVYSVAVLGNGSVNNNSYKGMTVNTNAYFELHLKKFQFPKPSNQ